MGLFAGPVGVLVAYLACYAVHGASNPLHSGLLHRQVDGPYRTSVLSLNSMMAQPAGALGGVVLTALAAATSVSTAMVVGAVVLAVAAPLYLPAGRPAAGGPAPRRAEHGAGGPDRLAQDVARRVRPRAGPRWRLTCGPLGTSRRRPTANPHRRTDMLAILAAIVFGFALLIDLARTPTSAHRTYSTWNTLAAVGLLLLSLYLAGVGIGPRGGGGGRWYRGRRPGRG